MKNLNASIGLLIVIIFLSSCSKDSNLENMTSAEFTLLLNDEGNCDWQMRGGSYVEQQELTEQNTISLRVEVAQTGDYVLNTESKNGYSFSAEGRFTDTGEQLLEFRASGTPEMPQIDQFTVSIGNQSCDFFIEVEKEEVSIEEERIIFAQGEIFGGGTYMFALNQAGEVLWRNEGYGRTAAVRNDTIYYHMRSEFVAADVFTGDVFWTKDFGESVSSISFTLAEDTFYGTLNNDSLVAISAQDGEIQWGLNIYTAGRSAPTISNGVIYVASVVDTFYAINSNGTVKWAADMQTSLRSSPAVGNSKVYFGSDNGEFFALNISDGSLAWSQMVGTNGGESPSLGNTNVFIQGDNGLFAFDAHSGTESWSDPTSSTGWSTPSFRNNVVYATDLGSRLFAYKADTGEKIWEGGGSSCNDSPVILDDIAYVSASGGMYAVSVDDGANLWNYGYLDPFDTYNSVSFKSSPTVYVVGTKTTYYPADNGIVQ